MLGFAKVPTKELSGFMKKSGQLQAYAQRLARDSPEKLPIFWVKRNKEEGDDDYVQRANREAVDQDTKTVMPLAWRPGRNSIGIVGKEHSASRTTHMIRGAPEDWGTAGS